MSAELVGVLSVGATLVVGGLAIAAAIVGLILRLEGRLNARMDAMDRHQNTRMDRLSTRIDRMDDRMDTLEARQYEIAQTVARMEATQQAMLATLGRIEERTRPAGEPPQPSLFETGPSPADSPSQSEPAGVSNPA